MILYTIGFTRSTAEHFFSRLEEAGVRRLIDVRLITGGQLSGFAKDADLKYLLCRLTNAKYVAQPLLAPTAQLLTAYRNKEISWDGYAAAYLQLLEKRNVIDQLDAAELDGGCLLCSEHIPERCHRRLAAEYMQRSLGGPSEIKLIHL